MLFRSQALSRQGAAVLIEEHEIAERLRETVVDLLESKEKRREIEERVKAFAHPDANRSILEDIMRLTARK